MKLLPIDVLFDAKSTANILSVKLGVIVFEINMDTSKNHFMLSHIDEDNVIRLKEFNGRLYYFNTMVTINYINKNVKAWSFLSTISDNKKYFTRQEVEGGDWAHNLQQGIGLPPEYLLKEIVRRNKLINCPITINKINRYNTIYGIVRPLV